MTASKAQHGRIVTSFHVLHAPVTGTARYEASGRFPLDQHPNLQILHGFRTGNFPKDGFVQKDPNYAASMRLYGRDIAGDYGVMRIYPRGEALMAALESVIKGMMREEGVMQVHTPVLFKEDHPLVRPFLERYGNGHYLAHSETRDFFLRSSLRLGHLRIFQDAIIDESMLPLRLFEIGEVFPRFDRRKIAALKTSRQHTAAEMNVACADLDQAKQEIFRQIDLAGRWMDAIGIQMESVIQVSEGFFAEARAFVEETARRFGRPLILEVLSDESARSAFYMHHYYMTSEKRALPMSFSKIDLDAPRRFDIRFNARDGKKTPIHALVEASVSGLLERNLFTIIDLMERRLNGKDSCALPFWLAPTQVRVVPVDASSLEKSLALARQLPYRCDVDDRNMPHTDLSRKVRRAFREDMVPVVVALGEREFQGGRLNVKFNERVLDDGFCVRHHLTLAELLEELRVMQGGLPVVESTLPILVSRYPLFREITSCKEPKGVRVEIPFDGPHNPYVSTAGMKLHHAIEHFGLEKLVGDKKDWRALDLGAATGGFTDCLLQKGCSEVHAVDLEASLHANLRGDSRVHYHPGISVLDLKPEMFPGKFDLITIDVSGISILQYLDRLQDLLAPGGKVLGMVKLAFEHSAQRAIEEFLQARGLFQGRRAGFRHTLSTEDIGAFQEAIAQGMMRGEACIIENRAFAGPIIRSFNKGVIVQGFKVLEAFDSPVSVVGGEGMEVFLLMQPNSV